MHILFLETSYEMDSCLMAWTSETYDKELLLLCGDNYPV